MTSPVHTPFPDNPMPLGSWLLVVVLTLAGLAAGYYLSRSGVILWDWSERVVSMEDPGPSTDDSETKSHFSLRVNFVDWTLVEVPVSPQTAWKIMPRLATWAQMFVVVGGFFGLIMALAYRYRLREQLDSTCLGLAMLGVWVSTLALYASIYSRHIWFNPLLMFPPVMLLGTIGVAAGFKLLEGRTGTLATACRVALKIFVGFWVVSALLAAVAALLIKTLSLFVS